MYINCSAIWNAEGSPTKGQVSCCESCHDDDEEFNMGLIEFYEDEIVPELKYSSNSKCIGGICCAVSHALDKMEGRIEFLQKIYLAEG
jgi:hypothetical protein